MKQHRLIFQTITPNCKINTFKPIFVNSKYQILRKYNFCSILIYVF